MVAKAIVSVEATLKIGTASSGDHGHAGRPGHVGGSAPRGTSTSGNPGVLGLPSEDRRYSLPSDALYGINQIFVNSGVRDFGLPMPLHNNLYAEYLHARGTVLRRYVQGIYDQQTATHHLEDINDAFVNHLPHEPRYGTPLTRAERLRAGLSVSEIEANTVITPDVARPPEAPRPPDISETLQGMYMPGGTPLRGEYDRERQQILDDWSNISPDSPVIRQSLQQLNEKYTRLAHPPAPRTPEQQWWQDMSGGSTPDQAAIEAAYAKATSGNAKVDAKTFVLSAYEFKDPETGMYTKVKHVSDKFGDIEVKGDIYDSSGGYIGNFTRTIRHDGEVHHDYMSIAESAQQHGFGSRYYQNAESTYIKNGLKRITIMANISRGGYAWARMGFDFSDPDELHNLRNNLVRHYKSRYGTKAPPSFGNIKHAWTIAAYTGPDGYRLGKEVMMGSTWYAYKELTPNSLGRQVGNHYYDSKKKGKGITKALISIKGGTGSGFHGHAGRPGEVGGSQAGDIANVIANNPKLKNAYDVAKVVYDEAEKDPIFRKMLIGFMADGEYGGDRTISQAIEDVLGAGEDTRWSDVSDIENVIANDPHLNELNNAMAKEYSVAKSDIGWGAPAIAGEGYDPDSKEILLATQSILENMHPNYWDDLGKDFNMYDAEWKKIEADLAKAHKLSPERKAWEKKYYGKIVGGFIKGQNYAYKHIVKLYKNHGYKAEFVYETS